MDALIQRADRLEADVKGIKGTLERLEPLIVRMDERLKSLATRDEFNATRDTLKDDLRRIGERTARIEGAVERMPTTLQLLGFVLAVLGIAGLAKHFAP